MNKMITYVKPIIKVNKDQEQPNGTKRQEYLDWNDYFMAVCFLSAMRSKDPATQVGCF